MGLDWILWLEIGDTLIFKFLIVGRRSQELYSDVHMEEERDTLNYECRIIMPEVRSRLKKVISLNEEEAVNKDLSTPNIKPRM